MLYNIHISKADNYYYRKLDFYLAPDLLILDELGFKKLPAYSADWFFWNYFKKIWTGIDYYTTNKPFEQWGDIFDDSILANAILDRVVHHSSIFKINGQSYRTKNIKNNKTEV